MISFECDYSEGCHPKILEAFIKTNYEQHSGYGFDPYTISAKEKIRNACGHKEAEVFLLTGGTQTNQVVIDAILEPYQGIIAPSTGHIANFEAGAIEYTGHKVLLLSGSEGKLQAEAIASYCERFYQDDHAHHMVQPGAVFLTFPTEIGGLYSKKELQDIYAVAQQYQLKVYLDGARLGYGLTAEGCDVNLQDIATYTDAFYIGGTKIGALCGEAVVFPHGQVPKHFFTRIKQHGALLAKGRLLGLQFDTLFTDNLYFKLAASANSCAKLLREGFAAKNYPFRFISYTNQQFIILRQEEEEKLRRQGFRFSFWERLDEQHCTWRFVTSWATQESQVAALLRALEMHQE